MISTPHIFELVIGLALIGAGILLARFLYLGYRRAVVPGYLRNAFSGDLISVIDLGLIVLGVAFVLHAVLPLFAG